MPHAVPDSLVWLDQTLPFRRQSGRRVDLTSAAITDSYDDDPVVAVETGHPVVDRGVEFLLLNLLQLACPPSGDEDWADTYNDPPSPAELARRMAPMRGALDLVHPEHPMLQVRPTADELAKVQKNRTGRAPAAGKEAEETGEQGIGALLPDWPSRNDIAQNKAIFAKGSDDLTLGAAVVGPLLYAHIVLFPLGGGGYLGLPHGSRSVKFLLTASTLWRTLWLNVLPPSSPELCEGHWQTPAWSNEGQAAPVDGSTFAWLRRDLRGLSVSRGNRISVSPGAVHPAGIPMQRRYLLGPARQGRCALTGLPGPVFTAYQRWPGGLDYNGGKSGWLPLTVARRPTSDAGERKLMAVGGRPLRLDDLLDLPLAIGQHSPGHTAELPALQALPGRAFEVEGKSGERSLVSQGALPATLRATALDGEKVAVSLSERTLPLYRVSDSAGAAMLEGLRDGAEVLQTMSDHLSRAARDASGQPSDGQAKRQTMLAGHLRDTLATAAEPALADLIARLAAAAGSDACMQARRVFRWKLRQGCLAVFDGAFPVSDAGTEAARIARARRLLVTSVSRAASRELPKQKAKP